MGSQQFCLKWNNHQANMLTVFEHLLSSEALVDVTLACEGLSLKAHKMVLSACSPFFQSLFLENPCKHPIVIMKDMRYTDLKAIIDFMYRGEVNVSQDQLSALLKTAETLKVKGLAEVTGENKAGPNSLVKEELVKGSSVSASSGPSTQNRAESPPLSRRKRGRPRRRSLSGSNRSDSEDVPSKIIKEPDSPEVIEDMSRDGVSEPLEVHSRLNTNHTPSQVSSHLPSVHSSLKSLPSVLPQSETHVTVEEPPSGDEGEFDVEPSKLMEQTLTTDNMVYPDGPTPAALPPVSSIPSSESQSHTNQGQSIENQALVPCSMPSDPSTSSHITDDSSQDIKPHNLVSYEEPQMSPIAGTSHQDNSNSSMMMYLDTSGVPAIPGPSNYQLDKQSPSQQPQGSQSSDSHEQERKTPPNVCKPCMRYFPSSEDYHKHLCTQHCGLEKFSCPLCPQTFYWRGTLHRHLAEIHNTSPPFDRFEKVEIVPVGVKRGRKPGSRLCGACKRVFNSTTELAEHVASHFLDEDSPTSTPAIPGPEEGGGDWSSVPTPKNCGVCKIPLGSASDFQAHLSSQPQCRTRQLDCHLCPKSFIWPVTLQKHLIQHTDEAEREWFFCDICRKALVSSKAVFLHKKKFHPELFSHDLSQGEHSYSEVANESHYGADTPPMKKRGRKPGSRVCTPCKKTFTTQRDYILHQTHFHSGVLPPPDLDDPMSEPSSASPFVLSQEDEDESQQGESTRASQISRSEEDTLQSQESHPPYGLLHPEQVLASESKSQESSSNPPFCPTQPQQPPPSLESSLDENNVNNSQVDKCSQSQFE